jgi:hypothetical protein
MDRRRGAGALGFFFPHLTSVEKHLIRLAFTAAVVFALYRRIESIRALTTLLWMVMLAAVGFTIAAAYSGFIRILPSATRAGSAMVCSRDWAQR